MKEHSIIFPVSIFDFVTNHRKQYFSRIIFNNNTQSLDKSY